MSTLRISTLSIDVEEKLGEDYSEEYTVILRFGSAEIMRWPVPSPDGRWRTGYGQGYEERQAAAEEFVAVKLGALLRDRDQT